MQSQIEKTVLYLDEFWRQGQGAPATALDSGKFPAWVSQLSTVYKTRLGELRDVLLIAPKTEITVDQGKRLYEAVSTTAALPTLLIADRLPAKGRGTLVRLRIPHVIADHVVYAPHLNLSFTGKIKLIEKPKEYRAKLSKYAIKLATLYLLHKDELESDLTISRWRDQTQRFQWPTLSLGLFSKAFADLMDAGIIQLSVNGTTKKVHFESPEIVWSKLISYTSNPVEKRVMVLELPQGVHKVLFKFAGDTALAQMSELSEPSHPIIAMGSVQWNIWKQYSKPALTDDQAITVEVWKSGSVEFPTNPISGLDRYVNPIELALSYRDEKDPRIHLAVQEMLDKFNLKADLLWRTEW